MLTNRGASGWPGDQQLSGKNKGFLPKYMKAIDAEYLVFSNIDWGGYSYPVESISLPEGEFVLDYSNDNFRVYKLDISL